MHHYEFACHDCHKGFMQTLAREDYEQGEVDCPHCGSHNVELQVALPELKVKKSA